MSKVIAWAGAISLAAAAVPVWAETPEPEFVTRIVRDKPTVTLDPAKAYILVHSPEPAFVSFFKEPTEAERAAHDQRRTEALAEAMVKARKKYAADLERYNRLKELPRRVTRASKVGPPIEPTEADFSFPAFETTTTFTMGASLRFAKSNEFSLYLQEMPPGTYVYYGANNLGTGVCPCMGTVKFAAAAGTITALQVDSEWLDARGAPLSRGAFPKGGEMNDTLVRQALVIEAGGSSATDPRLPPDWMVQPDFVPVGFVPNWNGLEINRVAPIPGVLAYDRDRLVDLKAQARQDALDAAKAEVIAEVDAAAAKAEAVTEAPTRAPAHPDSSLPHCSSPRQAVRRAWRGWP